MRSIKRRLSEAVSAIRESEAVGKAADGRNQADRGWPTLEGQVTGGHAIEQRDVVTTSPDK